MKPTTVVWLAARNVGDASDSAFIIQGTFAEVITGFAKWLGSRSMATRFDIVLARNESDAIAGISRQPTLRRPERASIPDDVMNQLIELLEESNS